MASRYYSSVAALTTLSNGVSAGGTSFIVGSTSGFPVQTPFTLLIDEGTTSEEIVTVTAVAGLTLTVTRGEDGTVAVAHDPGARVRHAMTARDLRESREHEAATTNVHGVTGALASAASLTAHTGASSGVHGVSGSVVGTSGTQTLTGKTMSGASNTFSNIPQSAVVDLDTGWVDYTPTWTGTTNPSVGNGSLTGRYKQIGKTVHFQINQTFGSTTTYGTGTLRWSLPVTANGGGLLSTNVAYIAPNGGSPQMALVLQWNTASVALYAPASATDTRLAAVGQTAAGVALANGGVVRLQGTYEAL